MTGIDSYSITPATNATADGGSINWAEGQAPSTVNNSTRQWMADERAQWNDAQWFQYGTGDQGAGNLAVPYVYASSTSVTVTGANVTVPHHADRRMKFVGSTTGTIYGTIASSSFAAGATTINLTWDSGSLSNETLTGYLSQSPITGQPINASGVKGAATTTGTNNWTGVNTFTNQVNGPENTLTDSVGGTVSWDANTAQMGYLLFTGTANNRTIALPDNRVTGGSYVLILQQSATGSNTVTWASGYRWPSGGAPNLTQTASGADIVTFVCLGGDMFGVAQYNFT